MSFYIAISLMSIAGLIGGVINYVLAKGTHIEGKKPNFLHSVLVGVGATILVPLFLELAQSKLLDEMRPNWQLTADYQKDLSGRPNPASAQLTIKDSISRETNAVFTVKADEAPTMPPIKTYMLFAAYCFLAAVAGPRFINSLIDGVLKEKEIERLNQERNEIIEQKDLAEDKVDRQNTINRILAIEDEQEALKATDETGQVEDMIKPKIGPITVEDDPQKGRFGGARERNGRRLSAKVQYSPTPGLYRIDLWVESTDPAHPLDTDVIFYLHNTFRPSVFTIKVEDFREGKASVEPKTAWGAFTVGAVTDNGNTLLEYDLSSDSSFPSDFRLK